MSIEKLSMMNLVCIRDNLDNILKELILKENCQFINSYLEIENNDFAIGMVEENAEEILNMEDIELIKPNKEVSKYLEKLENLSQSLNYKQNKIKKYMKENIKFEDIKDRIDKIIEKFEFFNREINDLEEEITNLKRLEFGDKTKEYDINFLQLMNMEYLSAKIGYLSKEKRKRISRNYENISAVVIHLDTKEERELYLIISPKSLDIEMSRILRSTNFKEIHIKKEYLSNIEDMEKSIKEDIIINEKKLEKIKEEAANYIKEKKEIIDELYSKLFILEKVEEVKEKVGASQNYAYISAWIPKDQHKNMIKLNEKYENILLKYKAMDEVSDNIELPTYMKNNFFFKPFEQLVTMYGVPSNNEIDPTPFFALAYILLFGAMFGDLGQGLVISLVGFYISKKKKNEFGKILSRIGIGSMIFGFFYDSFFGYERIISKYIPLNIYLRPMDNINTILIIAIGAGLVFLSISYIYSLLNKYKNKDYGELYFGRNGLVGLLLFWDLIIIGLGLFLGHFIINRYILYGILIICAALLFFKEPLANIINKPTIKTNIDREYYIESGFNIFENFFSLFSNSVSFIRVGAFAINHVGLFLAFHTLANIIGSIPGNILMFLLGNIIIIGLEGLIVFIQGLRLFYYELFSKYYSGEGTLFLPEKIEEV